MPLKRTLKATTILLFLGVFVFVFFAHSERRREARYSEGNFNHNLTVSFDVKGYFLWGAVVLEFQTVDNYHMSQHSKIKLNATDLVAIRQVEWLQGNKAVLITLIDDYDSDGGNHVDRFFYNFSNNQLMTTCHHKMTDKEFMDFVSTWKTTQKHEA